MYKTTIIVSDCPEYIEKPNEKNRVRRRVTPQDRRAFDIATLKDEIKTNGIPKPLYVTVSDHGKIMDKEHHVVIENIFFFHYDKEYQVMIDDIYAEIQKEMV